MRTIPTNRLIRKGEISGGLNTRQSPTGKEEVLRMKKNVSSLGKSTPIGYPVLIAHTHNIKY